MMKLVDLQRRMSNIKGWSFEGSAIMKEFSFSNFDESMNFVGKVAEVARKYEHHPEIIINYKNVRIILTTHDENGLTEKDFNVAEDIDKI